MKRIILLLLMLAVLCSPLVGCGSEDTPADGNDKAGEHDHSDHKDGEHGDHDGHDHADDDHKDH